MISTETRLGTVTVSNEYFAKLIGYAASSCYGVAGMVAKGAQRWREFFSRREQIDKGILVKGNAQSITVDLHIVVTYGININAAAKAIVHKVKYTVEEATGITVDKVTVHIDGMKA
ncbi:MAG: Asp23/Gls24 family envelope stress response protein [Oscillospiraceae bacterium]|jgi:uncharacterized alkaline shock family protein YloU|nr:Asp23/Gls24 family envelope stress response protein [Oscillospiraceae bacterium]